jgi:hypothetical protein
MSTVDKLWLSCNIKALIAGVRDLLGSAQPLRAFRICPFFQRIEPTGSAIAQHPGGIPLYSGIFLESRVAAAYLSAKPPRDPHADP